MPFNIHKELNYYFAKPGTKISLKKFPTDCHHKELSKEEAEKLLQSGLEKLEKMQDKLYAHDQFSILIVFQAMDAAGKDSTIKHVMSGLNPQGVNVTSFKVPTSTELNHDFFWRHYNALPPRGQIGIFNRSHYENVLVTRIHPELILKENLPEINKVADIKQSFWEKRYKQINRFEKNLVENGTIVLKFFLHLSKEEQKKRFLERIDDPTKNWKFSYADLKERSHWDEYQKAYEEMINKTSTPEAPWFIIPADDKWFTRALLAAIINAQFDKMDFEYPVVTKEQKEQLMQGKAELLAESDKGAPKKKKKSKKST
jgi:PPK2 family polyphosphate:nucleotide phosphotransferase